MKKSFKPIFQKKHNVLTRESKAAIFFLLPSILGICFFYIFPFGDTIRRSLFSVTGGEFLGFTNYQSVFQNEAFQLAVYNTSRFTAMCIPVLLVVSLVFALMLRFLYPKGVGLKTLYLLPMAIPVSGIALLWQVLFHRQGVINSLIVHAGGNGIDFINSSAIFWVLIGTYIWKNIGYNMVLWISGLDTIPDSLYDAAKVDGGGAIACFRFITLPCLYPVIGMVMILSLLNSFKVFREAYLVAGDYPNNSIYMLQHLFNNWFADLDMARLSTAATLLCIVLLVIIFIIQSIFRTRD